MAAFPPLLHPAHFRELLPSHCPPKNVTYCHILAGKILPDGGCLPQHARTVPGPTGVGVN